VFEALMCFFTICTNTIAPLASVNCDNDDDRYKQGRAECGVCGWLCGGACGGFSAGPRGLLSIVSFCSLLFAVWFVSCLFTTEFGYKVALQ